MDTSPLVLVLLIVLDIVLWVLGAVMPVRTTNRFRLLSSAYLVLCLVLTAFFGWKNAAALAFGGLWIAAIVVSGGPWKSLTAA